MSLSNIVLYITFDYRSMSTRMNFHSIFRLIGLVILTISKLNQTDEIFRVKKKGLKHTTRVIEQIQSMGINRAPRVNAKNVQSRWTMVISIDMRIWTAVIQVQWIVNAHVNAMLINSTKWRNLWEEHESFLMSLPRKKFTKDLDRFHFEHNKPKLIISNVRLMVISTQGMIIINRGNGIWSSTLQKAP